MKTAYSDLEELARRFEAVCRSAESVDLRRFLEDNGFSGDHPALVAALHRLIPIDMAGRWKRNEVTSLDHYLDDFAELGPMEQWSADFIFEEYRVRHAHGDKPEPGTYRLRFPNQFPDLQRLWRQSEIGTDNSVGFDKTMPAVPIGKPEPAKNPRPPKDPAPKTSPGAPSGVNPNPRPPSQISGIGMTAGGIMPIGEGYQLIKRIGSGGFGEVWRAEAPGGVPAAIKIIFRSIDHDDARRELDALELIKSLRHPFLVQTTQFSRFEDRLFIVMELADGNLRDRLKECRQEGLPTIPLEELFDYFRDAGEALDYLHSKHVQHRDIKPDNIMLVGRHAKLADFGLARVLEQSMHTATGSGTPPYMAPEIWMGKVSEHSDQYALACTYAELRLNRRLFQSTQLREMMLDHLERTPDLSGLPDAEQAVILKALAKEPANRYPTCKEFIRDLERALAPLLHKPGPDGVVGGSIETAGPSANTQRMYGQGPAGMGSIPMTIPVPDQSLSRRALLVAGIGLPLAGLGIFLAWYFWPRIWLPPNARRAEGAQLVKLDDGQQVYDRIEVLAGGEVPVLFLLIPRSKVGDPSPFYVMENKVWNGLFRRFMDEPKSKELLDRFAKELPWTVQGGWEKGALLTEDSARRDLGASNPMLPVFNITVIEAYCFAEWLGGGNLPKTGQWDKAAGHLDGKLHPHEGTEFAKAGEVGIKRPAEGPLAVGTATRDISMFGCRDMAGNGKEFTRNWTLGTEQQEIPLLKGLSAAPEENGTTGVQLRGASYQESGAYTFRRTQENPDEQPITQPSQVISFRVVIEIPAR